MLIHAGVQLTAEDIRKVAALARLTLTEEEVARMTADIARILQEEGYIWNYEVVTGDRTTLKVKPKFIDGRAVLTDLKRVSTPGRRHYVGSTEIPRVMSGLGISILSTSKGVMSGGNAKRQNLGGELLANVW